MQRYSHVNFEDVEPSQEGEFEGRFARKHLDSRELGVSRFRLAPGTRSPMVHKHREQEEAYVVTSGSGRVLLDEEVLELRQWDVLRVTPEVARAFEGGPNGIELIAVGGSKPEGGDGERADATWPD